MSKKRKQESKKDRKKRVIHNIASRRDKFLVKEKEREKKIQKDFFANMEKSMGLK